MRSRRARRRPARIRRRQPKNGRFRSCAFTYVPTRTRRRRRRRTGGELMRRLRNERERTARRYRTDGGGGAGGVEEKLPRGAGIV